MSHNKHRKETDCLNCGSELRGTYCHICGQENIEPKDTVTGFVSHFVYDITHFDGKFFRSLKFLLFKPGFLSLEYMRGRRASYISPIKMYVFTSAIFFIIFFWIQKSGSLFNVNSNGHVYSLSEGGKQILEERRQIVQQLANAGSNLALVKSLTDSLHQNDTTIVLLEQMGVMEKTPHLNDSVREGIRALMPEESILFKDSALPKNLSAYQFAQQSLPEQKKDGWLKKYYTTKKITLNNKYKNRLNELGSDFIDKFMHSLPKMMFISLPLVAFFLYLLNLRQKKILYVNHGIHVIHFYIAAYFFILLFYFFLWLKTATGLKVFLGFQIAVVLLCIAYAYKSMRNFYKQSRFKTILKFVVFCCMVLVMYALLATVFVLNSFIDIGQG